MEPTGQQTTQPHPKMSIKVNRNLHYRHFLQGIATCNIIIGEWLRSPSDSFNICFCVLRAAQILKVNTLLSFRSYGPLILTLHLFIPSQFVNNKQRIMHRQGASITNNRNVVFTFDVCRLS